MKVLLLGSGVTSAVTGVYLRNMLPDCNLYMWDKAKGTGGRMSTSRSAANSNSIADLGAQYITTTVDFMNTNKDIYDYLLSENLLEPLKCNIINMKPQGNKKNFVAPNGTGYLIKQLFQKAKVDETKFSHHVSSINKDENKWTVETKCGDKGQFDIVILTMPVPQLVLLDGNIKNYFSNDLIGKLETVTYSSRYALSLCFSENLTEDWGAQYFDQDPVFRYVAIDNIKRNQPKSPSAAVFHTTVGFGLKHVDDAIPEMEKVLLPQAKMMFPTWPEPNAVKCHKWRYSQVTNVYPGSPGCLVVSTTPPLICGGDSFIGSTFDDCIRSSKSICDKLKQVLQ